MVVILQLIYPFSKKYKVFTYILFKNTYVTYNNIKDNLNLQIGQPTVIGYESELLHLYYFVKLPFNSSENFKQVSKCQRHDNSNICSNQICFEGENI